jgi:outer membrane murein-binding lipoprotein Lpp
MAEFASKGVAGTGLGLGIAGLSVALLNGGLGGLGGILGGGATNTYVDTLNSKIAELQAEKYADKTGIEVYKAARESDAKTNARFEEIARTIADMRVREAQTAGKIDLVAATANQGIATNSAAIACLQNTVSSITKVVVPNSACCPGWGGVTITPTASTTTTGG